MPVTARLELEVIYAIQRRGNRLDRGGADAKNMDCVTWLNLSGFSAGSRTSSSATILAHNLSKVAEAGAGR
jgi:hypothetical protein